MEALLLKETRKLISFPVALAMNAFCYACLKVIFFCSSYPLKKHKNILPSPPGLSARICDRNGY